MQHVVHEHHFQIVHREVDLGRIGSRRFGTVPEVVPEKRNVQTAATYVFYTVILFQYLFYLRGEYHPALLYAYYGRAGKILVILHQLAYKALHCRFELFAGYYLLLHNHAFLMAIKLGFIRRGYKYLPVMIEVFFAITCRCIIFAMLTICRTHPGHY